MVEIISFTLLDMVYVLFVIVFCSIVYAVIKSYFDNRRWEKHIYQILEQYRSKYGVDEGCELLLYERDCE